VQAAFDPGKTYLGVLGIPQKLEINLEDVAFTVGELAVENDSLVENITILDTSKGKIAKLMTLAFRPNGTGILRDNNSIEDYQIVSFSALPPNNAA